MYFSLWELRALACRLPSVLGLSQKSFCLPHSPLSTPVNLDLMLSAHEAWQKAGWEGQTITLVGMDHRPKTGGACDICMSATSDRCGGMSTPAQCGPAEGESRMSPSLSMYAHAATAGSMEGDSFTSQTESKVLKGTGKKLSTGVWPARQGQTQT